MPYFKITTNLEIESQKKAELLKLMTSFISENLNKPVKYIMVYIVDRADILMNNTNEPLSYVELLSIGLSQIEILSKNICSFISQHLGVNPERIYIEFKDAPRNMFGWNNKTFA